ncbi:hypothetical protein DOE51_10220 [Bdellovibrio sp. NC01]|nr:hypothetical protein DOE51_10220 [Bdellovibrio sp. NC01]
MKSQWIAFVFLIVGLPLICAAEYLLTNCVTKITSGSLVCGEDALRIIIPLCLIFPVMGFFAWFKLGKGKSDED